VLEKPSLSVLQKPQSAAIKTVFASMWVVNAEEVKSSSNEDHAGTVVSVTSHVKGPSLGIGRPPLLFLQLPHI
jgi:hypothetical protein